MEPRSYCECFPRCSKRWLVQMLTEVQFADCGCCSREFAMAHMHYVCPFCDGILQNVAEYWNLQEYYPYAP